MKKFMILLAVIISAASFAVNILEIEGSILLKQQGSEGMIELNKDSTGLMLLPGDILEVNTASKSVIGDDISLMEIYAGSEFFYDENYMIIKKGRFFIDSIKIPVRVNEKDCSFAEGRAFYESGKIDIVDGKVSYDGNTYEKGLSIDLNNLEKRTEITEEVMAEMTIPPEIVKEELPDKLNKAAKNLINKKALSMYKNGKLDDAIAYLENAVKDSPKETSFLNNLGVFYHQKKDYKKAMQFYKNVLFIKSDDPSAYYNIICIFSVTKDEVNVSLWYRQAKPYLSEKYIKAMEQDPDLEFFRKTMKNEG